MVRGADGLYKRFEECVAIVGGDGVTVCDVEAEGAEYAAGGCGVCAGCDVGGEVRESMVWKYDLELSKIEKAFGVTWSNITFAHTLISGQTQEESLERLAAHDFGAENDYGFPYDEEDGSGDGAPIVESRERALHDAKEEYDGVKDGRPFVYAGRGTGNAKAPILWGGERQHVKRKQI